MQGGILYSISISPERGQLKKEVPEARVIENFGIENDGHAGDWDRQVTCLNKASVDRVNKEYGLNVGPGGFAENLLIEGIDLVSIGVGGMLKIGEDVILKVMQIGKEDHPSIVTRTYGGITLLPYEGLFCRVVKGGIIRRGDKVEVL
ncbi:MOSC domain-containing protein [Thermosyntropha lipolytica DSM 11003]|uniref:MOSC domain-containing protein n=1 Tax=Thermosyntropha lipolytica DSM 11003 TaxID=1123382 RepID=A0A1M5JE05_9FIRM|nr:MOSC domain-containing protein [Thermosyntropha lipolytica]SHG38741.1 MOSC domain-containing protein [Thermosyntropha lipolytica DSM 11003]